MKAKTLLSFVVTGLNILTISSACYAACDEEFPNTGFRCTEEPADSFGFGVFVGPTPDLVLNLGIESFAGLFGACITPLDRNGNQISECTVCDDTAPGGEEDTCETNVFPVELRINQS